MLRPTAFLYDDTPAQLRDTSTDPLPFTTSTTSKTALPLTAGRLNPDRLLSPLEHHPGTGDIDRVPKSELDQKKVGALEWDFVGQHAVRTVVLA
jgi:hypothetical protein